MALTAAVAAGAVAAGAYIDAKLSLRKDIYILYRQKAAELSWARSVKQHRESLFYRIEEAALEQAAYDPPLTAIWSRSGCYTWAEYLQQLYNYGKWFLSKGVKPGDVVALYLQNAPDFVFAYFGLLSIGCTAAFINYNLAGDALIHCVKLSGAKMMIADEDSGCQERINGERSRLEGEVGADIITLNTMERESIKTLNAERPGDELRDHCTGSQACALIYTSGTTGLPKAFPWTQERLGIMTRLGGRTAPIKPGPGGTRWYSCMPMYHGTASASVMGNLLNGASIAIGKKFSVSNFWNDIHDSEATTFVYVGETARYLLAAPPHPLERKHKLECMFGNGLRPDVWTKFQERFNVPEVSEFFNSTEGMFGIATYSRNGRGAGSVGHHGWIMQRRFHKTYVPVRGDPEKDDIWRDPKTGFAQRIPYSEGGEIIVKIPGRAAFSGYWRAEAATQKKFIGDVFEKGDLYYRPGDALRRNDDGYWYFMDRLGDTYRWKSENVSTAEVQEKVGTFPGIVEANVYGVQVPGHEGRTGCAAVTLAAEAQRKMDWQRLATTLRKQLPKYAVPVFIRVLAGQAGGLASHNQKQDKVPLRAEGVDPKLAGTKVPNGETDRFYWLEPESPEYRPFGQREWDRLVNGKARL